jgi:hypothetical protein
VVFGLSSGYVQRAESQLPKQGAKAPWVVRQNYFLDRREAKNADVTEGMRFEPKRTAGAGHPPVPQGSKAPATAPAMEEPAPTEVAATTTD